MSDTVLTETRGHVRIIRMNRPDKRNAVDQSLADALSAAFDKVEADPGVRVAVLTGTPDVFSAGTDMREPRSPVTATGGEYGLVRRVRRTPVVAAVEGPAYGGGFEIVLACDLVVASATARFALPEVQRGLVAACGALFRAPRALPHAVAVRMLLTGDPISADEAAAFGLIEQVSHPGGALDDAVALAERIAANSPSALAATLDGITAALADDDARGWVTTDEAVATGARSPDHDEGRAAFFEKRAPRWT